MSLKPISPNRRTQRNIRPMGAPVVVVRKKESGAGGLIVVIILLLALGGAYFVYDSHQKKQEALAARQHQLDENARKLAEVERQRAEHERGRHQEEEEDSSKTALGTAIAPSLTPATAPVSESSSANDDEMDEPEEDSNDESSALGSTSAPSAGDGVFAAQDTTPPPFDLSSDGSAQKKVIEKLAKAIDEASEGNTFHDLQADLKRSFDVAQPTLFADSTTLPAFPDKEQRLLRLAQGIYVCLNLAAELEARDTVPEKQHARFVNWLLKEKAKAARTFVYGLEHYSITDVAAATDLLDELRQSYLTSPSTAMKKIKPILEAGAK